MDIKSLTEKEILEKFKIGDVVHGVSGSWLGSLWEVDDVFIIKSSKDLQRVTQYDYCDILNEQADR